ncbi:hypothetical protein OMW55_03040 [Sphingomonas sp. BN140010]|uniref:Uncharacterized protein n=1 Tax=Sphingomonas arvum TaxID=2992113 RepID=A0ABT3JDB1_9SPHN|nr:hypothetical protein [Sphingomonas sp. BN140010]MCW3796781.1 hypothetical protein [Sphingomonas sp. BN140010]
MGLALNHKRPGLDLHWIAGHDFGLLRLKGEAGYKRARHDDYLIAMVPLQGTADCRRK